MIKIDKAYEVKHTRVFYNTHTTLSYIPNSSRNYDTENYSSVVTNSLGEELYRNTSLYNRVLSFYFYTKQSLLRDFTEHFNKVNTDDVVVAGETIPKYKGLLLEYTVNKVNVKFDNKMSDIYKVNVLIEVEVEKPLYEVSVPIRGYFFKHPTTGRKTRIQFSSCPSVYINNKNKYPYAVEVWGGYGFYSEDRPDLNITEPILLTKNGAILGDVGKVEFISCVEKKASNWGCLRLPKETGVEEGK